MHQVTSLRKRKPVPDLAEQTKELIAAQGECAIETGRAVLAASFAGIALSLEMFRVSHGVFQLGLLYRL